MHPQQKTPKALRMIPPAYLLLAAILMVCLHLLAPISTTTAFPWNLSGLAPLLAGIVLNILGDRSFKRNRTTIKPLGESTALVTKGVFSATRNPMYLGFVLILLGIALLLGSLTPLLLTGAFALFLDYVFIRFEERKMEQTFGRDWLRYKSRVRRWI